MSFDGFETRLEFSKLLRTLSASQQSIQIVVSYALKYASRCADDLWDVIMEQCGKVRLRVPSRGTRKSTISPMSPPQTTLNMRINILYFIDSLCDPMLSVVVPSKSSSATTTAANPFPALLARHFRQIIDLVVPPEKEGVLNLLSTKQVSRL
jgi:CTD kinase subunit gamma